MKEDDVNEPLDQLGMVARGCQASGSNALFFKAHPAGCWDTLDGAEGCDVTD